YMPTRVRQKWGHSTKTKWWYVGVGAGVSIDVGVGVSKLAVKLRNMWGQEATGSIGALGGGFGLKAGGTISLSADSSFMTDREVGFENFHGAHVRYTTAGVSVLYGYSKAYLTFWDLGAGAASIPVGGWSKGVEASASLNDGLLHLHSVP